MALSRLAAVANITEAARSCKTCNRVINLRSTSLGVQIFTCEHTTSKVIEALSAASVESTTKLNGRWVCIAPATASALAER